MSQGKRKDVLLEAKQDKRDERDLRQWGQAPRFRDKLIVKEQ